MVRTSYSWSFAKTLKTAEDYYRERRQRRRKQLAGNSLFPITVAQIADSEYLYECFQELREEGGPGPGIDKVTYSELGNSEAGDIMRKLSAKLLNGTYRPQPTRLVQIPKPGKDETRPLRLGVICDRVVGKALNKALGPVWALIFHDCSWGFRLERGAWQMLAAMENQMVQQDCWVVASDDLESAFENVPIDVVIKCHRTMLDSIKLPRLTKRKKAQVRHEKERLVRLVETVLRGNDCGKTRGIDQGGPYSPCALNVLLHYRLDEPLASIIKHPSRYFRYADNLVYLGRNVSEGRKVLARISRLLAPMSVTLKGEGGIRDLTKGEEVQLLGFTLQRRENRLVYGLSKQAYDRLSQHLSDAHDAEDPPTAARQSVFGWVSSAGPAYESGAAEIPVILRVAAEYGFRELASPDELRQHWEDAWKRWQDMSRVTNGGRGEPGRQRLRRGYPPGST